jgi:hypothetical protein
MGMRYGYHTRRTLPSRGFTSYCQANAPLTPLLHTEKTWRAIAAARNKETISGHGVQNGSGVWICQQQKDQICGLLQVSQMGQREEDTHSHLLSFVSSVVRLEEH